MRYVMAIVWSFLISSAISYVLSSMANEPFNFTQTLILTGTFAVIVFLLDAVVLSEKEQEN